MINTSANKRFLNIYFKENLCSWTQIWLLTTWKPVPERRMLVGMETLPYSGGWQPGEKVDSSVRTNSPRFYWTMSVFKEGINCSSSFQEASESLLSSTVCRVYDWWWDYRKLLQDSCAQPEKEPACQHRLGMRDADSIRGFRRSPGGGHGNPF